MCKGEVFESEARVNEKRKTRGMCAYRLVQSHGSSEQSLIRDDEEYVYYIGKKRMKHEFYSAHRIDKTHRFRFFLFTGKMSDEEVIRRRLLIDGDGIGDDRRINILLKSFIKWANSPDVDNTLHERMLSQLAQCEFAQRKSRLVSSMSQEELKSYEQLSKEIEIQIEDAKQDIEKTKAELQDAKRVRKNRIEYDVLAKVINEQPDRVETNLKLATLREELGKLKEKSEQLEHKLEMRRKQFHVLISSIHSLQGMLDECDEIMDISLENYEDPDTSTPMKSETS
ncbi:THO complex subunit 7 like protein [Melipona quadrifasciata]|uniref:THO complex subunit 7 like protein n=1 Tax=Melipona quadrifasciata TaxID=166423 RepID=A0A0M9A3P7_9HYME|nr:THO complex subunit 7 like protein [Melipona quadrifasciata]